MAEGFNPHQDQVPVMKKWRSRTDKEITFTNWDCVLSDKKSLLYRGLILIDDIRFFMSTEGTLFVVTIPRNSPFRLVNESYHYNLFCSLAEVPEELTAPSPESSTWKIWGTKFVRELDHLLFMDTREEDKFQYLIITCDECPEFISAEPPRIDVYEDADYFAVVQNLFETDLAKMKY